MNQLDVEMVKGYILGLEIWAPIASFILMVFQSLVAPRPAFLITFSNAALFGWVKGAILSWSSAVAGAELCFYNARYFGRGTVERLTSRKAIESVDVFFKNYGKYAIFTSRLLPFVSFDRCLRQRAHPGRSRQRHHAAYTCRHGQRQVPGRRS